MNAAIVAIGDELLTGQTQDINTSYIARALAGYGITVVSVSFVADEMAAITDALASAAARSSLIITTGGIGPTSDDITRHGVAEFSGKELELRQVCLDKLVAYLKEKGRELTETNKRQAYIPKEAEVVPNDRGTADGFITTTKFKEEPKKILTLPGVPREMRALLDKALPELCSSFSTASNKRFEVVLKVFGLPESDIGQEIERLGLDKDIIVAYRPHFPVVTVELFSASSEKLLAAKEKVIAALGGQYVFAQSREATMAGVVGELLVAKNKTMSLAESCTGGLVGHRVVSEAGSSSYFCGGVVSYSNKAKQDLLSVDSELLENHGAVSLEVAEAMARGALMKFDSDFAISVTGVAGPDGGSEEKPVGTVCFGFADRNGSCALRYKFSGNRDYIRQLSAIVALDIVRRNLLDLDSFSLYLEDKSN